MTILPNHFLKLMSNEDRAKLAKGTAVTTSEAQHRWMQGQERLLHTEFENWLKHHPELYYDHSRMDQKTTNRVGHPDFVIQAQGKVLNIEAKAPMGLLSKSQKEVHAWIESTGGKVHVCRTTEEAIKLTRETFNLA